MANYKLQEMNDLRNTGRRTVYPKVVTNRTMDTNDIVEKMKGYNLGIAPSTTKAVLENISDILVTMLSMGYNVKLDGIGTFSLSIGFEDDKPKELEGNADKMPYRKVGVKGMNFKMAPNLPKASENRNRPGALRERSDSNRQVSLHRRRTNPSCPGCYQATRIHQPANLCQHQRTETHRCIRRSAKNYGKRKSSPDERG